MPRPVRVKLAPSILTADFATIANELGSIERAGADYVHIDIMDGRFVPRNLRITFIAAGLVGGIAGYLFWLEWVGPLLIP